MSDALSAALSELAETLSSIANSLEDGPGEDTSAIWHAVSVLYDFVDRYDSQTYDDNDVEALRTVLDNVAVRIGAFVVVSGIVILSAPLQAGAVAIFISTQAAAALIGDLLASSRISFLPLIADASSSETAVTVTGFNIQDDVIISSTHSDALFGLSGGDWFLNSGGSDEIYGGVGRDTIDYSNSDGHVDLVFSGAGDIDFTASHATGVDSLSSVDDVYLTTSDDTVVLSSDMGGGWHFWAGDGHDSLYMGLLGDGESMGVIYNANVVTYNAGGAGAYVSGFEDFFATAGNDRFWPWFLLMLLGPRSRFPVP